MYINIRDVYHIESNVSYRIVIIKVINTVSYQNDSQINDTFKDTFYDDITIQLVLHIKEWFF